MGKPHVIEHLWLIGIGTGSPAHVTGEGLRAIADAAVILVPHKGSGKDDLAELRHAIIAKSGSKAVVVPFEYPVRDPELPYLERVEAWHDDIAARWVTALAQTRASGPIALLVWGDPALYDSTIRIARRLRPAPNIRVVAGITAVQALTAAHAIPLNNVNSPIQITTGRRLRDHGWPEGCERLVVMLDGEASFQHLDGDAYDIWWGAYLGMNEQVLENGRLGDVTARIIQTRATERARHGWIMDTYLLSKRS